MDTSCTALDLSLGDLVSGHYYGTPFRGRITGYLGAHACITLEAPITLDSGRTESDGISIDLRGQGEPGAASQILSILEKGPELSEDEVEHYAGSAWIRRVA